MYSLQKMIHYSYERHISNFTSQCCCLESISSPTNYISLGEFTVKVPKNNETKPTHFLRNELTHFRGSIDDN